MSKKRFMAWLTAVVMLFSALPLQSLAETTYAQDFFLVAGQEATEQEFRQWASDLVRWYRDEYLCLDGEGNYKQRSVDIPTSAVGVTGDSITIVQEYFDQATHHLYYKAGQAFSQYKSVDTSGWHNSDWKYADQDSEKSTELYMIILADTLWEKMDELSEEDEVMAFIQLDAEADAREKAAEACLALGQTAIHAILAASQELKTAKKELENQAKEKLSGKKQQYTWNDFLTEMIFECKQQAVDVLFESLKTKINKEFQNYSEDLNNQIKDTVSNDLASAYLQARDVVVDYLSATYVENSESIDAALYQPYKKAATRMMEVLSSKESGDTMRAKAKALVGNFNIQPKDIMTDQEMKEYIIYDVFMRCLEHIVDMASEILTMALKVPFSALESKGGNWEVVAEEVETLVNNITKELQNRTIAALDNTLKQTTIDDSENWIGQICQDIADEWKKQMNGSAEETDSSFESFVQNEVIKTAINIVVKHKGAEELEADENERKKAVEDASLLAITNGNASTGTIVTSFSSMVETAFGARMAKEVAADVCTAIVDTLIDNLKKDLKDVMPDYVYLPFIDSLEDARDELNNGIKKGEWGTASIFTALIELCETLLFFPAMIITSDDPDIVSNISSQITQSVRKSFSSPKLHETLSGVVNKAFKESSKDIMNVVFDLGTKEFTTKMNALQLNEEVVELFPEKFGYDPTDEGSHSIGNISVEKCKATIEQESSEKLKENATVEAIEGVFNDIWNLGQTLGSAAQSAMTAMTGAASADYVGQLMMACWQISSSHENILKLYTAMDMKTADLQQRYKNSDSSTWMYMTPENILDPEVCPDVNAIKVITDLILTQLNEDLVGMGSGFYKLASKALDEWKGTGYVRYIGLNYRYLLLIGSDDAEESYKKMLADYNHWIDSYPFGTWNTMLFTQEVN